MNRESTRLHWVDTPSPPSHLVQWDLGAGKTAVLSLAISDPRSPVVLDDHAARRFALSFDIPLIGTLGIILKAKQKGLVPQVKPLIEKLIEEGANLSESIRARVLKEANE